MNNKVNPLVSGVIIAVIAIVVCVLLYKHNFKPTEDNAQSLPAAERAKIQSMYGTHVRPPHGNGGHGPAAGTQASPGNP